MAGYELIDGRCADIDECETATPCNPELYVCSNIEGLLIPISFMQHNISVDTYEHFMGFEGFLTKVF